MSGEPLAAQSLPSSVEIAFEPDPPVIGTVTQVSVTLAAGSSGTVPAFATLALTARNRTSGTTVTRAFARQGAGATPGSHRYIGTIAFAEAGAWDVVVPQYAPGIPGSSRTVTVVGTGAVAAGAATPAVTPLPGPAAPAATTPPVPAVRLPDDTSSTGAAAPTDLSATDDPGAATPVAATVAATPSIVTPAAVGTAEPTAGAAAAGTAAPAGNAAATPAPPGGTASGSGFSVTVNRPAPDGSYAPGEPVEITFRAAGATLVRITTIGPDGMALGVVQDRRGAGEGRLRLVAGDPGTYTLQLEAFAGDQLIGSATTTYVVR